MFPVEYGGLRDAELGGLPVFRQAIFVCLSYPGSPLAVRYGTVGACGRYGAGGCTRGGTATHQEVRHYPVQYDISAALISSAAHINVWQMVQSPCFRESATHHIWYAGCAGPNKRQLFSHPAATAPKARQMRSAADAKLIDNSQPEGAALLRFS